MAKDFSPEEKLLNLIKKRKKERPPTPTKKDEAAAAMPKEETTGYKAKKIALPPSSAYISNILNLENIRILNLILLVMLISVIIFFLVDIFLMPPEEAPVLQEKKVDEAAPKAGEEIGIKPYSYYSKGFNRELFKPLAKEEAEEKKPEVPLEEIMGNLALLGIVSGERPQAIIEDKKQNKTFFLSEGQSAGGIFLKHIEVDSVTVVYKGEEFNLTL